VSFVVDIQSLFKLAQPKRSATITLSILTGVEVLLSIPGPLLFAWLIERAMTKLTLNDLLLFSLSLLVLELSSMALRILRVRLNRVLALDAANRLRDRFFTHILHLPYMWYLDHRSGGQSSSYLSDIDDIDRAVTGLVDRGMRSILMMVFLSITFLIWNPLVAIAALITIPITILLQRKLRKRVRSSSREKVDCRENLVSTVSEAVTHFQAVKAFVLEKYIGDKVEALSERYAHIATHLETRQAAMRSSSSVMLLGVQYAFFIFGALLVLAKELALSAFLGQMVLLGRLVAPMNTILDYSTELSRCRAALSRVQATLDLQREDDGDEERATLIPRASRGLAVEAKDLTFSFDDRLPLMEGWNFFIQPGQRVALVGASGSGKTTLLNLLLGLHSGYGGQLKLDGLERRDLSQVSARRHLGVVFQEQQLFNVSIRDNLSLALEGEVGDEELWKVLEMAHAAEFVREFPGQLDTIVGVDGIQCSGGQRQRLAIAQTLLRDPPLLLLDEATSALDSFSEAHIQGALTELMNSRTSIVVAHRLSTVRDADLILVIDQGVVAEQGRHHELLDRGGLYAKLCRAQVQGFLGWDDAQEEKS
jgi:ABC-type multidrug transport system fused ATPase/permease subunit